MIIKDTATSQTLCCTTLLAMCEGVERTLKITLSQTCGTISDKKNHDNQYNKLHCRDFEAIASEQDGKYKYHSVMICKRC